MVSFHLQSGMRMAEQIEWTRPVRKINSDLRALVESREGCTHNERIRMLVSIERLEGDLEQKLSEDDKSEKLAKPVELLSCSLVDCKFEVALLGGRNSSPRLICY